MGRVAKYKKIKAFDPYSKQNAGRIDLENVGIWGLGNNGRKAKKVSLTVQKMRRNRKRKNADDDGFDLPPNDGDEFDMLDLEGSLKKQKVELSIDEAYEAERRATNGGPVATIPKTDEDERKVARILKVEEKINKVEKEKLEKKLVRMEGESKKAHRRRTKLEVQQTIKKDRMVEKNPEKRDRKKDFMKNKRKRGKGTHVESRNSFTRHGANEESDSFITGEQAFRKQADQVKFGEQAERPPTFRHLPRGAKAKDDKNKAAPKSSGMTEARIAAENNAMEIMRRKVQAQYAIIKAKRRKDGDFHL